MQLIVFLMYVRSDIWKIYFVYPLINYFVFQEMILLYHVIQIINVLIVYWIIIYYYSQTIEFCSCITYCMVFVIGYLVGGYQLELDLFVIILCTILLYLSFERIVTQAVKLQGKINYLMECTTTVEETQTKMDIHNINTIDPIQMVHSGNSHILADMSCIMVYCI